MNAEAVKLLVAQTAGLVLSQNESLITTALNSTLEEIGVNLKIVSAIKSETKTLAASDNKVMWNVGYSQLISVVYQYTVNGIVTKQPLEPILPTQFAIENAGLQDQVTDYLKFYCPKGDYVYVGPGNSYTGGSLIIEYQRKLTVNDVEHLPDSYMVVWGTLGNLLPTENPSQERYRNMFVKRLSPATTQAKPTLEKHSKIQLPDQIIRDEMYLRNPT